MIHSMLKLNMTVYDLSMGHGPFLSTMRFLAPSPLLLGIGLHPRQVIKPGSFNSVELLLSNKLYCLLHIFYFSWQLRT